MFSWSGKSFLLSFWSYVLPKLIFNPKETSLRSANPSPISIFYRCTDAKKHHYTQCMVPTSLIVVSVHFFHGLGIPFWSYLSHIDTQSHYLNHRLIIWVTQTFCDLNIYIHNTLLSTIFITMSDISINKMIFRQNDIIYISRNLEKVMYIYQASMA